MNKEQLEKLRAAVNQNRVIRSYGNKLHEVYWIDYVDKDRSKHLAIRLSNDYVNPKNVKLEEFFTLTPIK